MPNLFSMLGNAPVALRVISSSAPHSLAELSMPVSAKQFALAVAENNLRSYCLSAHTAN